MRLLPWGAVARVVAVTGWGQQQDRARTAEAGFDAHLVKPVTDLDLRPFLTEGRKLPC
jgi:CheY-like chemotaxis protein